MTSQVDRSAQLHVRQPAERHAESPLYSRANVQVCPADLLNCRFNSEAAMQPVKMGTIWTCSALVLALFASHIDAARPPPPPPAPHLPINPNVVRSSV